MKWWLETLIRTQTLSICSGKIEADLDILYETKVMRIVLGFCLNRTNGLVVMSNIPSRGTGVALRENPSYISIR